MQVDAFRLSLKYKILLLVFIATGIIALNLSFRESATEGWFAYFMGSVFFLGFGLAGFFFTAIQHLTSARWSVGIRRVMEAMALTLPAAALLFIGVYIGRHHLYEWTHAHTVAEDALLQLKEPFLNEKWFGIRLIIYFFLWISMVICLIRNSFNQDTNGSTSLTIRNKKISAPILVIFGLSVSLAGFDIVMSLEPHWFSTIFGVYFFSGFFQAGLCLILLLSWVLYRSGVLSKVISVDHFHDMARFIFGFSIFWAYIGFSQFMLIWYGDLPEETFFFKIRMEHGWEWVGLAVLLIRWLIPFLVLMPYGAKRSFKVTVPISCLILLGHWLDIFWISAPVMRLFQGVEHLNPGDVLGWKEIAIAFGFLCLFLFIVSLIMERIKMVPINDPRLDESIHYYHH